MTVTCGGCVIIAAIRFETELSLYSIIESIILKDDVADDSGMVEILKKISNSLI